MKTSLRAQRDGGTTRFRVELKYAVAIGPGKADVLQAIQETGSMAETGRRLGMSYQRVWTLVGALNKDFIEPLVVTQRGGAARGGAQLTATGARVLSLYRATEEAAHAAVSEKLPLLLELLKPSAD